MTNYNLVMSKEIPNSRQPETHIRAIWNIIRNSGCGLTPQSVYGVIAFMALFRLSPQSAKAILIDLRALDEEIEVFCRAQPNGAELKYAFTSLRDLIPATMCRDILMELARLSGGLTDTEFRQLAIQILDECHERSLADPGIFQVSREVAFIMLKLTEREELNGSGIFSPYVPHPGIAGMVKNGAQVSCCVPSHAAASIIAVQRLVEGGNTELRVANPEMDDRVFCRHRSFKRIIAAPPFGKRLRGHWSGHTEAESFCVDQVAKILERHHGTSAICVSSGFLFRANNHLLELRRKLVESGQIETVIQLPGRLIRYSSIAPVIIILKQPDAESKGVILMDASDCTLDVEGRPTLDVDRLIHRIHDSEKAFHHRIVSAEELEKCDFDLTPARHLRPVERIAPEGHKLLSLRELLKTHNSRAVRPEDEGIIFERRSFPDTTSGFEFSFEQEPVLKASEIRNSRMYRKINTSCLLVDTAAFRGEIRAFWFAHRGKDLFVRPDIRPMEVVAERADPRWAAMAINSKEVSEQVAAMIVGATIPRLRVELLLNIQVVLPDSLEKQKAIVRSVEELQIKAKAKEIGFEKLLEQQREDFIRDIRLRKHTLSQIARDISSRVSVIKNELFIQGKLQAGQAIGRQGIPLADYLEQISRRCDEMGFSLESLTKIHVFSPLEDLPLEQALKKLQASCKGRHFRLETNVHKDSFKDPQTGRELKPIIQIAAKDFTILCENIIDNAERHGFSDANVEHMIRIDVFLNTQEQMVDISFKNTGQHLPEGLTVERFVTRGEKGGATANTGIGGHHIKSLMDHANGNVKIQDLAHDIYRVEVKLSFPFQP